MADGDTNILTPDEGKKFVNKVTGEVATQLDKDNPTYKEDEWVQCSTEDVDKWQASYELYMSVNGNNIWYCNGWDDTDAVGQIVYDQREGSHAINKNPTEDEYNNGNIIAVTYEELLLGYNDGDFILPTDSSDYNSDYNASKYTFANLMDDNGISGYTADLELKTYLETILETVNSAYNSYLADEIFGESLSASELPDLENVEDIQIFNGLYEDAFDIQAI